MKIFYTNFIYLLFLLTACCVGACKNPANKYTSPQGYNFNEPDKFNMPSSLLEISGIAFYKDMGDTIYSIQDEDGKLFRQKWDIKKQYHTKFGPKGDYEDLAIFNEMVFVLESKGTLYSFPFTESTKEKSDQVKVRKKLLPKGEYESLYADPQTSKVYILCKKCDEDKKTKQVSGYIFDYEAGSDSLIAAGTFKIDLKQLKAINSKLKASLGPSALTKNLETNEWYILSSANKLLVVADPNWKIKAVHKLNSSTFNQPEGIAFDDKLNLYIANEGDEVIDGNILKFKYLHSATK